MAVFRVLYVDDEPGLLEISKIFLEQGGQFTVDTIGSAPAALALLNFTKYDAIVSDYQMPEMDGIELLKKVRKSGNTIPFILFTGRGREEVVLQAINEGADFYLQKGGDPVSQFTELSHKIRQAVQKRQAEALLLESQKQLRTVVDSIQAGIVTIDAKTHRILNANPKAIDMIGADAGEIIGQVCHKFICPADMGRCPVTDLKLKVDLSERVLLDHNGNKRPILKSVVPAVLDGEDVLIESFFDITGRKQAEKERQAAYEQMAAGEEELRQKNLILSTINELEREFADLPSGRRVEELAAKKLSARSGSVVTVFSTYYPAEQQLKTSFIEFAPGILESLPGAWEKLSRLMGMDPDKVIVPLNKETYHDINRSIVGRKKTITEISYGKIPPLVSASIQKLSGIDRFIHIAHIIDGELYGTSVIGLRPDRPDPSQEFLESFAHIIAVSLRRQQAELALRESEDRYRTLIENADEAILVVQDDRICFANPKLTTNSGYSSEEFAQRPYLEFVHPDDRAKVGKQHGLRLSGEILKEQYTCRMLSKAGTDLMYEIRASLITWNGRPAVLVLLQDITERKKSEDTLRESEEKYRLIADNTADNIWILDMDFRFQYISPSVKKMRGFTVEEAMALPIDRHMTPDSLAGVLSLFQKEMEHEAEGTADPWRRVSFETEEYCTDGSTIRVENSVTLLRDAAGRPNGILGISRDITDRKRVEAALRESEEKFRSLVETSPDLIWEVDVQGKILYISPTVRTMMGYTPEEITGRSIFDLVTDQEKSSALQGLERIVSRDGSLGSLEVHARHRDGRDLILEIRPALLTGRELKGLRGVAVDITDRRISEEALRQANKKLGLLSGITRHDISNQLLTLNGFVSLLHKMYPDPASKKYFSRIEEASSQINAMIRFTKEYEKIGVHVPVWRDLTTVLDTVEKGIIPGQIAIKNTIPAGFEVFADPMLEKVFSNLLDNSLRHGERMSEIRVSFHPSGKDLIVVWEDNGVGIPAGEKERIFERGVGKNTGLGLFLAREILSLTGITITETGEPGKDARFEIRVPDGAYRVAGV